MTTLTPTAATDVQPAPDADDSLLARARWAVIDFST